MSESMKIVIVLGFIYGVLLALTIWVVVHNWLDKRSYRKRQEILQDWHDNSPEIQQWRALSGPIGYAVDDDTMILTFGPNVAVQAEILVDKAFHDQEQDD